MVVQALEAECRELHRQYVSRRDRLLDICAATEETFGSRRGPSTSAMSVTAGVVAFSSLAYAWGRLSAKPRRLDEVAIRIPIGRETRLAR